jgi:CBS domain-containing protein
MKIEQLYRAGALVCRPADTLADAARRMRTNQVGALAVCDPELLVGVISEHDLTEAVADGADPNTATVDKYATPGVRTVGPEEDFSTVAARMLAFGIRHMPVVQDGTVRGMLSMRDLFMFEMWASHRNQHSNLMQTPN